MVPPLWHLSRKCVHFVIQKLTSPTTLHPSPTPPCSSPSTTITQRPSGAPGAVIASPPLPPPPALVPAPLLMPSRRSAQQLASPSNVRTDVKKRVGGGGGENRGMSNGSEKERRLDPHVVGVSYDMRCVADPKVQCFECEPLLQHSGRLLLIIAACNLTPTHASLSKRVMSSSRGARGDLQS